MKTSFLWLAFCVGSALAANATNPQSLITFDDLVLQSYGGPIPNGYAGLNWDNFGVLDPQAFPGDSVGYLNGMVSPRHVAFNAYANSDGTTTGGFHNIGSIFDLNSAYLTAAWNDGLQVEALGFIGGVLTCSNTYTLNTASPALVNFNYLGIDTVEFISYGGVPHGNPGFGGTQTAIDNLAITVPEPEATSLLLFGACFTVMCWQNKIRAARSRHESSRKILLLIRVH